MSRILVVDDNDSFRKMLRIALEKAGYDVGEACDGKSCCDTYLRSPYDIVVMDLVLPEKDGIESIHRLREEFSEVKIIAVSGIMCPDGNSQPLLDRALDHGADFAMRKPIKINKLLANIEILLQS
ncbi:MAG: response regulator [bacterium]|nr:response regulator [bacterium]